MCLNSLAFIFIVSNGGNVKCVAMIEEFSYTLFYDVLKEWKM